MQSPTRFTSTKFSQTDFANQETKNRANGLSREDHYKPDKVPNGVRWKNLLRRHLPSPAAGIPFLNSLPEIHFLELAKGFEPPTP
jgi:hypothetical protein